MPKATLDLLAPQRCNCRRYPRARFRPRSDVRLAQQQYAIPILGNRHEARYQIHQDRQLRDAIQGLQIFKDRIHGGIFNLRFGEFGPEYASGALDARFQFRKHGKILVRVSVQSAFQRFEEREFASEAKLFLVSEPALLDAFVDALTAWRERGTEQAEFQAVFWN